MKREETIEIRGGNESYTYIIGEPINVHALQKVVSRSINRWIWLRVDDVSLWSYEISYRGTRTKNGIIINDVATIAHHTQEIATWLESLTLADIDQRRKSLYGQEKNN